MARNNRPTLLLATALLALLPILGGCCKAPTPTGEPIGAVRLGDMDGPFAGQMPFEILPVEQREAAKAGDSICTTYPGLFLDFRYTVVAYTSEGGLVCGRFTGWDRQVVTSSGTVNLREFTKEFTSKMRKNLPFFKFND